MNNNNNNINNNNINNVPIGNNNIIQLEEPLNAVNSQNPAVGMKFNVAGLNCQIIAAETIGTIGQDAGQQLTKEEAINHIIQTINEQ